MNIFLIICSLLLFAQGWDWLKDILNSAEIFGCITWPTFSFPVKRDVKVELVSEKNIVCTHANLDIKSDFKFSFITPGIWTVRITGTWITTIEKKIEAHRWQKINIGTVPISFNNNKIWQKHQVPNFGQIVDVELLRDGSIWAVGFKTLPKCHNIRMIMQKKTNNTWKEIIIPQFLTAERACFVRSISSDCLVVGSLGAGGVYSIDSGKSWKSIMLPTGVDSFIWAFELPDKTIIAYGWEWNRGYPKRAVILKYSHGLNSDPKITKSTENSEFSAAILTESGRLLIGEKSYQNGGKILYSEDFGESWLDTNITANSYPQKQFIVLGITSFIELNNLILAGTTSVKSTKNDNIIPGGAILRSHSNPIAWKPVKHESNLGDIKGLCSPDGSTVIFLSSYQKFPVVSKLFISADCGTSWNEFIEVPGATPLSKLDFRNDRCVVFGMNNIAVAAVTDLLFDRFS